MKAEAQESGVLTAILAATRARLSGRQLERSEWERQAARAQPVKPFAAALTGDAVAVIAEVKRRSPSSGAIRADADAVELARQYADAGAAAISVLTEPDRFGGNIEDLLRVARQVGLPTLRKDFIIDPIQVYEAKAVSASAVLLIVRALDDDVLGSLSELAHGLGLSTLVEVHNEAELKRALAVRPSVIGVNARDLETLVMTPGVVDLLLPMVAPGIPAVAESGLKTKADVERVAAAGADAVLVGTAVAGAADPRAALRDLAGVVRTGRRWV